MTSESTDFQLTDPSFHANGDPFPLWKRLRAEDPVHWTQGHLSKGFWSVTRLEDCRAVFRDAIVFSSERGGIALPTTRELEELAPDETGAGEHILYIDPPRHVPIRKAFHGPLLRSAVHRLEERGRRLVETLIDRAIERDELDFVDDLAVKLPMVMILDLMDVPREDWAKMLVWARMTLGAADPEYQSGSALETRRAGGYRMFKYCLQLAQQRRLKPGNDLLSVIANAKPQGRPLTDRELGFNSLVFIDGGLETTRNAISDGMLELINRPDEWRRLRDNPGLIKTAVEEIIRFTSPLTHTMRTATRDFELGGRHIHENDRVVIWNASANRDEEAFANPDRLDVGRTPNDHLGFGYGEHFCIGAHLARLEIRLMLEQLIRRKIEVRLVGKPERMASLQMRGLKRMPVRLVPH
ncbi:MAG: cytochrome P450 [Candidatus Binataceae bacterium]